MEPLDILINTQTPLVQFVPPSAEVPGGRAAPAADVELANLREGIDYRFSPGGVTRMVYPLVRHLLEAKIVHEARWVALNPNAPPVVRLPGMTLHSVALDPEQMAAYGRVKEALWSRFHEIDGERPRDDLFWTEAFAQYTYYNRATTELIHDLDRTIDFDVYYIHDFQQLPVGHMLGTLKPKIFRWHIPFDAGTVPEAWRALLRTYLASYDVVVVSSERYAAALREFGHAGRIELMYPYVDRADYSRPPKREVEPVVAPFGIAPEDTVALVVGRMDPIKGQDRAIEALGEIAADYPRLKLVLVGNGSFSGSRGGPGGSKSERWRERLRATARAAGVESRVVFTGHLGQRALDCFYERCRFTVMPSVREGFGLVAVESWLHDRPAIVTNRAGLSELVQDGHDGLVFDPEVPGALAARMRRLLDDTDGQLARKLVQGGRAVARKCSIAAAVRAERTLLARLGGS